MLATIRIRIFGLPDCCPKIKIYRNVNLLLFCADVSLSLMLREQRRLSVFENRVLRKTVGPEREEVTGNRENYKMRSLIICTPNPILFG
jgi:hypothetical protein